MWKRKKWVELRKPNTVNTFQECLNEAQKEYEWLMAHNPTGLSPAQVMAIALATVKGRNKKNVIDSKK